MNIPFTLTKKEFLQKFLSIISSLRPPEKQISPLEKEVLITFTLLPSRFNSFPFSPAGKKLALSLLPMSLASLHAKIYSLLEKGYLLREADKTIIIAPFIRQALISFLQKGTYDFTFSFSLDRSSPEEHV